MLRLLPFVLYVLLVAYCLSDALQRPEDSPYSLPKWAWVLIILLFPYVGAGAWLFLKFSNRGTGGQPKLEPRGKGPDDDPDYLSWLREQERRRKQQGNGS
ncbi:PLD nuclease N-terminal domain-containing protein [Demequina aurantiaca]|uniref:PLD nuclease N-terminal domain-containing protein n=1 Tax=Demequina aurantiaca TaxID=676200 RepID=UPI00128E2F5C|nr:PLD nuclease N-terminal domain-containing protein [Demequina aurantiaca]